MDDPLVLYRLLDNDELGIDQSTAKQLYKGSSIKDVQKMAVFLPSLLAAVGLPA